MVDLQENQLQIRLITKQETYAVPNVPLSVPHNIKNTTLNDLVNSLLRESNDSDIKGLLQFDFLVLGELLRVPLIEYLLERNVSTETTVDVEYIKRVPAPEPVTALLHDDWISTVQTRNKWILTGCYDYSVNIWTVQGKAVVSSKQHKNIVKGVCWLDEDDPSNGFVSVSHDLTGIIWSFEPGTDKINPVATLRGHERGIDCVSVSPNGRKIVTGGWDTYVKIWSTVVEEENGEPTMKKAKGSHSTITKVPLHTLNGHKETISSTNWMGNSEICTSSMDHTIKFWDTELYGLKSEIIGQKSFLSTSWNRLSNSLLASSTDRNVRLYDPRSTEGSLCKLTFASSHKLWVSSVSWSRHDQHLFMSGGYDAEVKMWDVRSPRAPLYDLQGHEGQVMTTDWSNGKYLISGGCDNSLHVFKNKE